MADVSVVEVACLVAFLGLAALSAIFLKRLKFPYTIGLVVIGILVGGLAGHFKMLAPLTGFNITPNLILYVLLPALVFDAAVNIDIRLLIHNLSPTLMLAAPGLLVATLITGGLMVWLTPMTLWPALAFGALISATDPVSVIALFRELGAPRRLTMLVDGESLFNDATAMVAFQIICGLVAGGALTVGVAAMAGVEFVAVFTGGTLVGAVVGWLMVRMINLMDNDPLVTIAFSTVVAYASFLMANYYLEVSGVMATVGAGLVVSWYGSTRFTPEVREYMRHFWGYAAFAANSFVFLLLGLTEWRLLQALFREMNFLPYILVAVLAITVARLAVVFGMAPLINRLPRVVPVNWRNQAVIFWGGLRGALPIGLAVSLDQNFPDRQIIIGLTLGVVLFTLLVQGTTIGPLIRRLKLNQRSPAEELIRLNAQLAGQRASLQGLARDWPDANAQVRRELERKLQGALAVTDGEIQKLRDTHALAPDTGKLRMFWLQLNNIELQALRSLMEEGVVGGNVLRRLDREAERRSEDINLGLPPDVLPPAHPMEKRWGYKALMRMPAHALRVSGKNMLLRLLSEEYQYHCGLAVAGARVMEQLPHLAELHLLADKDVEAARRFYTDRRSAATRQLQALSYRHPELVQVLQKNMLAGVARASAREAIMRIAQHGGISDALAAELTPA